MVTNNDIRHGRHCVFLIHVHLAISKKLWGHALCSPSYFCGSCGGASLDVIRKYIEQQQTPD